MTAETILHRWFDGVWNKGREEIIEELMMPDCAVHGLKDADGNEVRGIPAFKDFYHAFRRDFDGFDIQVEDVLVEGDKMAARCTAKCRHKGMNAWTAFDGMVFARVEKGKVAEAWNVFDFQTMDRQLAAAQAALI